MSDLDERVQLFKLHPSSRGLSEEALREIAAACELVRYSPGEHIHRTDEPVTSLFLVIHGRLRVTLLDLQGNVMLERYQGSGDQFGGIAAALAEPTPMECVAEDPSTLLRIEYAKAQELSRKYDLFRVNYVQLMAESVKRVLFNDRLISRPKLVAFVHQSPQTRVVTKRLMSRLVEMGEAPGVFTDQAEPGFDAKVEQRRILGGDEDLSIDEVRSQAAKWLEAGRVFVDVATSVEPLRAINALEKCQIVFWCVTPQNWYDSVRSLEDMESRAPGWREKVRILWLLEPGEHAPSAPELWKLAKRQISVSFGSASGKEGKVLFNGFERLVHLVRGLKIGVALGGGAARGMAHIGVLKALEDSGITVDMIAGTSAGAMTGTLYAAGFDPDFLVDRFVSDLTPSRLFRWLPKGDQWYLLYKYRLGRFDPMLRNYLKDLRMEQLAVPMHTVTVDLIGGKPVVRDTGDAVHAILESINLPVLSTPINRQGQALVDGGLINNVPADVLVSKGCNFVIAVSVTATMETEFARNRPDTPDDRMRSASTIQTILRSFLVQNRNINAIGVEPADVVIEPDVTGFDLTHFTRTDELAAIGESTTKEAIPEIKRLLSRLDGQLFQS